MDSSVDFSVIIPSYKRPVALGNCLAALARQTRNRFSRFEVIAVDDGSPQPLSLDPSRWKDAFDLRMIRQENAGPAAARNRGATAASGKFLAFTDDDCLPGPGWLDSLASALEENPDALVGTATWNGIPENLYSAASQLIIDIVYDHNNRDPRDAQFLASNNFACARHLYFAMGGFDMDFPRAGAEDRDFCDRWRIEGRRLVFIPEPHVEHRHAQTFAKYCDLHFRYGRGAWLYRQKCGKRTRPLTSHSGFYKNLVFDSAKHISRQTGTRRHVGLASALVLWQVANTAGYFTECFVKFWHRSP
jgi:GT2 family glycosyltransferase